MCPETVRRILFILMVLPLSTGPYVQFNIEWSASYSPRSGSFRPVRTQPRV
jgi:hypothetical protein